MSISFHRFVRYSRADDYLRLGWLPLPTLRATSHGEYSVHMAWLCACKAVEPIREKSARVTAQARQHNEVRD